MSASVVETQIGELAGARELRVVRPGLAQRHLVGGRRGGAAEARQRVAAIEVRGVGGGDLTVELGGALALAQGLEGARRPVAPGAADPARRVEVAEPGPIADGAGVVAAPVLPPAALPEHRSAGGVGRIHLPQQGEDLHRLLEVLLLAQLDEELAQRPRPQLRIDRRPRHCPQVLAVAGPQPLPLGFGWERPAGAHRRRLLRRLGPRPLQLRLGPRTLGAHAGEQRQGLLAALGQGQGAGLEEVEGEVALGGGEGFERVERTRGNPQLEQPLDAALALVAAQDGGPVQGAVGGPELLHHGEPRGVERRLDEEAAGGGPLALQIAGGLRGLPFQDAQTGREVRHQLPPPRLRDPLGGAPAIPCRGGDLGAPHQGPSPQRRARVVAGQLLERRQRGRIVTLRGGAVGEEIEPPVLEGAARLGGLEEPALRRRDVLAGVGVKAHQQAGHGAVGAAGPLAQAPEGAGAVAAAQRRRLGREVGQGSRSRRGRGLGAGRGRRGRALRLQEQSPGEQQRNREGPRRGAQVVHYTPIARASPPARMLTSAW